MKEKMHRYILALGYDTYIIYISAFIAMDSNRYLLIEKTS